MVNVWVNEKVEKAKCDETEKKSHLQIFIRDAKAKMQ